MNNTEADAHIHMPARAVELLCSRLCHELISPVTAIQAGVELLSDMAADDTALGLLAESSGRASRRLQFYRLAYGLGGGVASALPLLEVAQLCAGMDDDQRVALDWTPAPENTFVLPRIAGRIIANTVLIALEALPRGGAVAVALFPLQSASSTGEWSGDGGLAATIRVSADRIILTDDLPALFANRVDIEALTPRNVHAYYTGFLAAGAGGYVTLENHDETAAHFSLSLPTI